MLKYIDHGYWSSSFNYKIKHKNYEKILNLIRVKKFNSVDDLVLFSFMNYMGIGLERNKGVAI